MDEEDLDGYSTLERAPEGLYITIFPPIGRGVPISFGEVKMELDNAGIRGVDFDAIKRAVEEKNGQPVLISKKGSNEASPVIVEFSPNGKEVSVVLDPGRSHGAPIGIEHVLVALESAGVGGFQLDEDNIKKVLEQQRYGKTPATVVARRMDGRVEVEISRDEMEAYIVLRQARGGREIDVADVMSALKDRGVVFGINNEAAENMIFQSWFDERTVVAEGTRPENGADASFEYLFDVGKKTAKPSINEEGQVDFYELDLLENVAAESPLVRKNPATAGVTGMTVTGREIPSKPGRDVQMPVGKGAKISEKDPNILVAAVDGMPKLQNKKVTVLPIYEVRGDVDFSTGNISFVGDVIIRGKVTEGFQIKAGGDIFIGGAVEGAMITAEGDISLTKGMHGQDKGMMQAGGNVTAKFLEHTSVTAGESINVLDAVLHCHLDARKNVIVEGGKGLIVGGVVAAGELVKATFIGSHLATPTEIEAGGNPKIRAELREIEDTVGKTKLSLDRTEKAVKSLKHIQDKEGALSPEKKDLLLQLTRTQFHLMGEMKKILGRKKELEKLLETAFKGKITVTDTMFPGVKIVIKRAALYVKDSIRTTSFFEKNGEIHMGTYYA